MASVGAFFCATMDFVASHSEVGPRLVAMLSETFQNADERNINLEKKTNQGPVNGKQAGTRDTWYSCLFRGLGLTEGAS